MKLSEQMRLPRDQKVAERDAIHRRQSDILHAAEVRQNKALLASEQREFDSLKDKKRDLDKEIRLDEERLAELVEDEAREAAAVETRRKYGNPDSALGYTTPRAGGVYSPTDTSVSFFKDLRASKLGDIGAAQRLQANDQEQRALGNTGAVGGSGGEWAPPSWLVEDFVALARAGRVLADRCVKDVLPSGVSSINIPKVSTGTSVGV